jgi:hypothetical protein
MRSRRESSAQHLHGRHVPATSPVKCRGANLGAQQGKIAKSVNFSAAPAACYAFVTYAWNVMVAEWRECIAE